MSATIEQSAIGPDRAETPGQVARGLRLLAVIAGPALIVLSVIIALRGFVLTPSLTNQHPDILAFWLPRFSFLGRSLSSGHVPLWNPFEFTGARFAADPQGGWLYLPAMAFFSWLSPGAAMRAFIAFNPMLAGLGLYAFLRKDSLHRAAATAAGLSLAMIMSASVIAISMPFAGTLAWTPLVLLGASGYRQSLLLSRRLMWLALAALAWSQVASAHMSHGLTICTLLVTAYVLAGAIGSVRAGQLSWQRAAARAAGFIAFLPLASLAVLLPHLDYIGTSSLGSGYNAVLLPLQRAAGIQERAISTNGVWSSWPIAFASAPGAYAGATILLASLLALRSRTHRMLVWAFGGSLVLVYILMLNVLVTAGWFRTIILELPYGDVYLHNPGRLRYLAMVAIPVLGGVGIQGLIERPMSRIEARKWLGAGVGLFLFLPLVAGAHPIRFLLVAVAMAAAVPALLALAGGRRGALLAVVGVLAVELMAGALWSQAYTGGTTHVGLESGEHPNLIPQPLRWPNVPEADFLEPNRFVDILRGQPDRYLTWVQPAANFEKGYLFTQRPVDWPALQMERGTLFGISDVLGYNPVQPIRYWAYIRATNPNSVYYNASIITEPSLQDIRLLGVRYLILPHGHDPTVPGRVVATQDGYDMIEVLGWQPRASVVPSWTVEPDPAAALKAVLQPDFDPGRTAVLEQNPPITQVPGALPGTVTYTESGPENVRMQVHANAPSLVVVRNNDGSGWNATVDGKPTPVLETDAFRQGIPVSAGDHEVRPLDRPRHQSKRTRLVSASSGPSGGSGSGASPSEADLTARAPSDLPRHLRARSST